MKKRCSIGRVSVGITVGIAAVSMHSAGLATPNIATDSAVFVEKTDTGSIRRLEPAASLSPGDKVVTILRWYRLGGEGSFIITNPLPNSISYQKSSFNGEQVSVDGGRNWGRIGALRIGNRMASPEDVTHVRWRISANHSARGKGQIAYSGIVR